jgi:hypothetical protein
MTQPHEDFPNPEQVYDEYVAYVTEQGVAARRRGESYAVPKYEDWLAANDYEIVDPAEVAAQEREEKRKSSPPMRNNQKYPWHLWCDGEWWDAEQGTHFNCRPSSFRSYLYNWALDNGYRVETMRTGDKPPTISFRMIKL